MKTSFLKDEKYIYFSMAYDLALKNNGQVTIGEDTGFTDGYHYERRFKIQKYNDKTLLIETKSSKHCADFSRVVEVINSDDKKYRKSIMPYINESGENCFTRWTH